MHFSTETVAIRKLCNTKCEKKKFVISVENNHLLQTITIVILIIEK